MLISVELVNVIRNLVSTLIKYSLLVCSFVIEPAEHFIPISYVLLKILRFLDILNLHMY